MKTLSFFVSADPVPSSRTRPSPSGAVKPDRRYELFVRCVERAARRVIEWESFPPAMGPCQVVITCWFRRKTKETDPSKLPAAHTDPPDCDNTEKGVLDGMEKAGVFARSDGQVNDLHTRKHWAKRPSAVGVMVELCAFADLAVNGQPMKRKPSKKRRKLDSDPDSVEFTKR